MGMHSPLLKRHNQLLLVLLLVLGLLACPGDSVQDEGEGEGENGGESTGEWSKTFGGERGDSARCVQQTSDGGYVLAGQTTSFGPSEGPVASDFCLVKTDAQGNKGHPT